MTPSLSLDHAMQRALVTFGIEGRAHVIAACVAASAGATIAESARAHSATTLFREVVSAFVPGPEA